MLPPSAVLRLTRTPLYFSLSLSLSLFRQTAATLQGVADGCVGLAWPRQPRQSDVGV